MTPAARAEIWLSMSEALTARGRRLLLEDAGGAASALALVRVVSVVTS